MARIRKVQQVATSKPSARVSITRQSINLRSIPHSNPASTTAEQLRSYMFAQKPPDQDLWRTRYGRALNLAVIEQALRAADWGNMRLLTDLSRETIDTDPHLASVLNKRFGAISALPWEVVPASGAGIDETKARFYADVVRGQLKQLPNFGQRVLQLAWGLFDGRAALEIEWALIPMLPNMPTPVHPTYGSVNWMVKDLGWIHPRRLHFGPERELRVYDDLYSSTFSEHGIALRDTPLKFIYCTPQLFGDYPEREGLARRALYWSFFKRFSARERMILLELYGKPWRWLEVDENSTADRTDLQNADTLLQNIGGNSSFRFPRGTKFQVTQPAEGAGDVHQETIEESDKQLSKLVLGQTGTTDANPAGLNNVQANVMQDEQFMILMRDAGFYSEVFETYLTDPIIEINYGPQELSHAPHFRLRADVPLDREKELKRLKAAVEAGLEIPLSEAYEISGFRTPKEDEPVIKLETPPLHPLAVQPPPERPVIVHPESSKLPARKMQPIAPSGEGGLQSPEQRPPGQAGGGLLEPPTATPSQEDGEDDEGDGEGSTGRAPASGGSAIPSSGASGQEGSTANASALTGERRTLYLQDPGAEGGTHEHQIDEGEPETAIDGAHQHMFVIGTEDGQELAISEEDGAHSHPVVDGAVKRGGEHVHVVRLPDGALVTTNEGKSEHAHRMQDETTATDGSHVHTLELPDGNIIESVLPTADARILGELLPSDVHEPTEIKLPFAGFEDWDDCVSTMQEQGHSVEEAEQICGALQRDFKGARIGLERAHPADLVVVDSILLQQYLVEPGPKCCNIVHLQDDLPESVRRARQPEEKVIGSIETLIEKGTKQGARELNKLAEEYIKAVDGLDDAATINAALERVHDDIDTHGFSRAIERKMLHGLMAGALANQYEFETQTVLPPAEFARIHGKSVLLATPPTDPNFVDRALNDAIKWFKNRMVIQRAAFDRLNAAAKRRAFTIAGMSNNLMLRKAKDELEKQVRKGGQLRDFQNFMLKRMASAGFTPANPSHVETVYRTNVLNSYNSGRYAQATQPNVLRLRPYWQIRTVNDGPPRQRATHQAVHLWVLRADDALWSRAYPPFGFNCRCRVTTLSEPEIRARSLRVRNGGEVSGLPDPGFTSGSGALL